MCLFKRKKIKYQYPEKAKYQLDDYVNFRYRNELYFGYICSAKINDGKVIYTIQIEGQCPSFIYNFNEEDIIGIKED